MATTRSPRSSIKSEANCRQIFVRARKHIDEGKPRFETTTGQHERLTANFLAAVQNWRPAAAAGGAICAPSSSVADLLHLWQFRDIRFFVSEHYLRDGKLTFKRRKVREQVVRELSLDFVMRGGFDTVICDVEGEDTRLLCYGSPQHRRAARRYTPTPTRLHAKDRPLLADALEGGCHVFLTSDKGVLARAPPSSPAAVSPS